MWVQWAQMRATSAVQMGPMIRPMLLKAYGIARNPDPRLLLTTWRNVPKSLRMHITIKYIFTYVIILRKTLKYIPVYFFLLGIESGVQGPKQSETEILLAWENKWVRTSQQKHENVYFGVVDISEGFCEGVQQPCHATLL